MCVGYAGERRKDEGGRGFQEVRALKEGIFTESVTEIRGEKTFRGRVRKIDSKFAKERRFSSGVLGRRHGSFGRSLN